MRPGEVYRNRRGDIVQIMAVDNDLAHLEVIKFKNPNQPGPKRYNFWSKSGSRSYGRYNHPNDIIERHQKQEDVILIILSKEDYPEYYL